jgi:hypothetical protein
LLFREDAFFKYHLKVAKVVEQVRVLEISRFLRFMMRVDNRSFQAANCLDIAAQELHGNGEPDSHTIAAKIETCVEEADRNLCDMYHVMNLQRLELRIHLRRILLSLTSVQPQLPKRFATSAHFFLQGASGTTNPR